MALSAKAPATTPANPSVRETDIRKLLDEIGQVVQLANLDIEPRTQGIGGQPEPQDPKPSLRQIGNDLVDLLTRLADESYIRGVQSELPNPLPMLVRYVSFQSSALPPRARKYFDYCNDEEQQSDGAEQNVSFLEVVNPKQSGHSLVLVVHHGFAEELDCRRKRCVSADHSIQWMLSFSKSDEIDVGIRSDKPVPAFWESSLADISVLAAEPKLVVERLCEFLAEWSGLLGDRLDAVRKNEHPQKEDEAAPDEPTTPMEHAAWLLYNNGQKTMAEVAEILEGKGLQGGKGAVSKLIASYCNKTGAKKVSKKDLAKLRGTRQTKTTDPHTMARSTKSRTTDDDDDSDD